MKNQPERLLEKAAALDAFNAGIAKARMEAEERHVRHQRLVIRMLADPDIHLVAKRCRCNAFDWPHAMHISRRCLGQ